MLSWTVTQYLSLSPPKGSITIVSYAHVLLNRGTKGAIATVETP